MYGCVLCLCVMYVRVVCIRVVSVLCMYVCYATHVSYDMCVMYVCM